MANYYGKRLTVEVKKGLLTISIGVETLAHATSYATWANPYDAELVDYVRTFAIIDPVQFAKDVAHAMEAERQDGSTPLSDFLDKASEAALDDGSTACEYEQRILTGKFSPLEKWASLAGTETEK